VRASYWRARRYVSPDSRSLRSPRKRYRSVAARGPDRSDAWPNGSYEAENATPQLTTWASGCIGVSSFSGREMGVRATGMGPLREKDGAQRRGSGELDEVIRAVERDLQALSGPEG